MKTLLDCDFVFDILTRGPFPPTDSMPLDPQRQADARAIENHLATCHECRQLAEALLPTADLFHEALSEEERATLPAFLDTDMMARLHSKIIEAVFETDEDPVRVRRIDHLCQRWLAPAMVAVPLVAACVLMWLFADNSAFSNPHGIIASLPHDQRASLRDMDLPVGCLTPISLVAADTKATGEVAGVPNNPQIAEPILPQHATGSLQCEQCHQASPPQISAPPKHTKSSCLQCHEERPGRESPIDKHHYRCCTSCHAAGKHMRSVGGHPKFAAACGSCHSTE